MVFIDTNIIIRYLMRDDENLYKISKNIIESTDNLFVPNEIIAEVVYVLTKIYYVNREKTASTVLDLINQNYFKLNSKEIIIKALEVFSSKNLDFVDCILCATSKLTENTVESFDKKLKNCLSE